MIYFICEKKKFNDVMEYFDGAYVESRFTDEDNFILGCVDTRTYKEVTDYAIATRTHLRFLLPAVSLKLYSVTSPVYSTIGEKFLVTPRAKSEFEELVSTSYNVRPSRDCEYYFFESVSDNIISRYNNNIESEIDKYNEVLKDNELYIYNDEIYPTLTELFTSAIKKSTANEIKYSSNTMSEIKYYNLNAFMDVLVTFIIMADEYYAQSEILEWLEENLGEFSVKKSSS